MEENEILGFIKLWSDNGEINPYAYYVLTHDKDYGDKKMAILLECDNANELYETASAMFE